MKLPRSVRDLLLLLAGGIGLLTLQWTFRAPESGSAVAPPQPDVAALAPPIDPVASAADVTKPSASPPTAKDPHYQLAATTVSSDPAQSRAILVDTATGRSFNLRAGDALPGVAGVRVAAVTEEGVRFEPSPDSDAAGAIGANGEPIAPSLPRELATGLSIGASPAVSPDFSLERLQTLLAENDPNRVAAGFEAILRDRKQLRDADSLPLQADTHARYRDGDEGVAFQSVESGSFLEGLGLDAGDVLLEVNGISIRDLASEQQAVQLVATASDLQIVVQRADQTIESLRVRTAPIAETQNGD